MARPPVTDTKKLTRTKSLEGDTLHFTTWTSRNGRDALLVIHKDHVPDFEGDEAWFLCQRVPATPWPYWVAIERVEAPSWARRDGPPRER